MTLCLHQVIEGTCVLTPWRCGGHCRGGVAARCAATRRRQRLCQLRRSCRVKPCTPRRRSAHPSLPPCNPATPDPRVHRVGTPRRVKYDEVLKTLGVRPLKMQAARGVMIKLTAEDQPTVLVGENVDEAPAV